MFCYETTDNKTTKKSPNNIIKVLYFYKKILYNINRVITLEGGKH